MSTEAIAKVLYEALTLMVKQFTKTPSTLKDTQARANAHKAIAAYEASITEPLEDDHV